jgi:signal peptidase II
LKKPLLVIFLILVIDQVIKVYIKTHMMIDESFPVFGDSGPLSDKAFIYFTENPGMAFGWEFAGEHGKLFLSIFRILAVAGIGWYLYDLVKKKSHGGFIISIALIFAGALGNIIDSAFYGLIFSDSNYQVAEFLPEGGGYAGFLHGKVVDMFYFPILQGHFPDWFPFWSNEPFVFFRPIFNFADASITAGVLAILIFQKRFFAKKKEEEKKEENTAAATTSTEDPAMPAKDTTQGNQVS